METNRIEYKQKLTDQFEKEVVAFLNYTGGGGIYYDVADRKLNEHFANNLKLLNEDGDYNYVGYLMADNNTVSIKIARYKGKDRVELARSNEYGFCSLIKATKQVLDRMEVENETQTKITSKERLEKRLWNTVALREAVINAIVHNDYTREIAPKFEFFDDRLEITSYGGIPEGLGEKEFFEGYSIPRNKEIMRIFRDLDLVEQLGSGMPRILRNYGKECFYFTENHIRMIFPIEDFGIYVAEKEGLNVGVNVGVNDLLKIIIDNPGVNVKQLHSYFDVTDRTIERWLKQLREEGEIEFRGAPKTGGYWKVHGR